MRIKNLPIIIISFVLIFLTQGCLLMHSVSYKIKPDGEGGGTAVLTIENIRSDALNGYELKEDKKNLFEFMYKSNEFIAQMKDEGKTITSRELFVENENLNGIIKFSFDDIEIVEGIIYEEPFYFLTLSPEDSIISTNGEVIVSDEYKRIMWDNTVKVLKFKMFSDEVDNGKLVSMAQYYESD
ncbi:MAG: hypothetical protein IH852_01000 [Bacteroidetes bacterium]|nr:hypothetical protein [Bacteroidota bacterium]